MNSQLSGNQVLLNFKTKPDNKTRSMKNKKIMSFDSDDISVDRRAKEKK